MTTRQRWWAIALDAVVVLPLLAALVSSPGENEALANLCTGLGMLATSLMVVIVLFVSRVRGLTRWLGLELGNNLHRRLGPAVAVATAGHVVTAAASSPRGLALLDPFTTPQPIKAGVVAALAMLVTVFLAVPRQRSRRYGRTVRVHGVLAMITLVYTGLHVAELGNWRGSPAIALAWLFVGGLLVGVLGWRWGLRPLLNHGAYVVRAVRPESPDIATVVLDPAAGNTLRETKRSGEHADRGARPLGQPAEPGQFVWLRRRRLAGLCVEHPFTIAASTRTGILELTVRRRGGFTEALCAAPPGTRVWLDGPHGSFVPASTDPVRPAAHDGGLVLIAGGVGITPMMSILRAHAAGADPRPHRLLLAERPGDGLFGPELRVLERRLDLAVRRTEGRRLDPALLVEVLPPVARERQDYFVCGPPGLVVAVLDGLGALGVPDERIHTEQFG